MEKRLEDLQGIQRFLQQANKEVTMVLQSLQWDRKHLLEGDNMVQCSIDANHRIPQHKKEEHEAQCILNSQGYNHGALLPDPVDPSAATLIKFDKDEIQDIIRSACPQSRPGPITGISEPLTLERLQATYTWEERRAIHDAVVQRAPQYGELSDLPLLSGVERPGHGSKTFLEIMAQQRDLKRRRAKYRVAAKTNHYSDVLRDVISTQMEMYAEVKLERNPETQPVDKNYEKDNKLDDVGHIEIKHEYVDTSDTDSRSYQENTRHIGERRDQKHSSSNNRTPSERDRSKYKYRDERNSYNVSIDNYRDSKKSHKSTRGQDRRHETTKSHDSRSSNNRQELHRKDKVNHEDRYKKKFRDEPSSSSARYYKDHDGRTNDQYERHEEYDDRSYRRNEREIKKEPRDDDNGYENHGSKRKKVSHRERDRSDKRTEKETHYREKHYSETSDHYKERRRGKDMKHEK